MLELQIFFTILFYKLLIWGMIVALLVSEKVMLIVGLN